MNGAHFCCPSIKMCVSNKWTYFLSVERKRKLSNFLYNSTKENTGFVAKMFPRTNRFACNYSTFHTKVHWIRSSSSHKWLQFNPSDPKKNHRNPTLTARVHSFARSADNRKNVQNTGWEAVVTLIRGFEIVSVLRFDFCLIPVFGSPRCQLNRELTFLLSSFFNRNRHSSEYIKLTKITQRFTQSAYRYLPAARQSSSSAKLHWFH